MKKILFVLLFAITAVSANAQRYAANGGNVGSLLTFQTSTLTDGTGNDTLVKYPSASMVNYFVTVNDSITINLATTYAQKYDEVHIYATNTSGAGHKVKLLNAEVGSGTATIALTSSKRANIVFVFDGTVWIEQSRLVQ